MFAKKSWSGEQFLWGFFLLQVLKRKFLNFRWILNKMVSKTFVFFVIFYWVPIISSSLTKGFAHGPLSLHPWQIELEFRIHAPLDFYWMQLLLAASNQIAANNQSLKHHVYAVENVNILHLPKHEIVKSTHWSKVMSSL